ncbi:MAG TPA: nucleotide exchange factor GrpE, partial [Terriglobales bacterium]|nr:nucleotide exchange factor GrpE [Terriglobales bacterium]
MKQARAEAQENHELFLRERAELQNFKRRMQRESSEALRYAAEGLLRDLLPVIDNLERALGHAQPDDPLVEGVKLVHGSLLAALAKHGVERIDALGQPFDPALHQAMMRVES